MTLQTDDMDLAGDVIQSLASYLGIEVYTAVNCVVMETPGGTVIHISAEMNSTIFEYLCNSAIGPHVMFHVSRSYSVASSSKSMAFEGSCMRDCWQKEGSLQVVRATCHNYFVCACVRVCLICACVLVG